ncbi:MAG: DUF4369 domain-containing protein [Prevotella sp.]|nr:DUF4369 domain-containing protein [Prevotella sp.]
MKLSWGPKHTTPLHLGKGWGWVFFIFLLTACGAPRGRFRLEGHFLKMNQAEFYVYSPDGVINGIDTIRLAGGRFTYEIPCQESGTLMIVFPNYSEHPIFAESGASVSLSGDASHLKELTAKGTTDNELISGFRKQTADASPDETRQLALKFIENNPRSSAAVWLFQNYFIIEDNPDVKEGTRLLNMLREAQPKNLNISRIETAFGMKKASSVGQQLPAFNATDIYGQRISRNNLTGAYAVVSTFSSWNYESQEQQRRLNRIARRSQGRLKLLSISLDASYSECLHMVRRDTLSQPVVCDGLMFDTPLLTTFGLQAIPDNVITDKSGKIIAHGLNTEDLKNRLNELLK